MSVLVLLKIRGQKMKKARIIVIVLAAVIYCIVVFAFYPNLNPLYRDGLFFDAATVTAVVLIIWIFKGASRITKTVNTGGERGSPVNLWMPKLKKGSLIAIVVPWGLLVLISVYSVVLFHVSAYENQMPQPEVRKFASDVQPLDVKQLPIVDHDLAAVLADKKLGEKPALGSQVTLGDPTIQKIDGKLVWAVPLLDSGFFKWFENRGGTPGYILVSATDPNNVTYVDSYKIKYQPNAYFFDNLERHTRFSGGLFKGLTDYSFEIDDSGQPYWVVTTYKNLAGFSLPEADGAIIVNASTGKAQTYKIDDLPSWVDRVQPTDYIVTQLNNRGKYIHGLFNFSNKDQFKTTGGYAIVYYNDKCYFYTGISGVGTDQSMTGLVLVDMVTKKPYIYNIGGATANAAQQSAEGKVQALKYNASYPLVTNIGGLPTYFMTLKDNAGLIKQYAFVSIKDYSIVGTGETVQGALNDYNLTWGSTGVGNAITAGSEMLTAEGNVGRIASELQDGNTIYVIILANMPNRIFKATYNLSDELALTREGDKVKITYEKTSNTLIMAHSFDNLTLAINPAT
jgi:hypothetical protein